MSAVTTRLTTTYQAARRSRQTAFTNTMADSEKSKGELLDLPEIITLGGCL